MPRVVIFDLNETLLDLSALDPAFERAFGDIRLVAAHGWDVAGALTAGCKAAFVARPEKVLSPKGAKPDISSRDLQEVAEQIIVQDG
jgi:2-haloacid dehalogenase